MKRIKVSSEKDELKHGHHTDHDLQSSNEPASQNEAPSMNLDTPFHPRTEEHTALLESARDGKNANRIIRHLQRSYGNAYVQKLVRNSNVQTKQQYQRQEDDEQEEFAYPGPRSRSENAAGRGSSLADRAAPHSSATGAIGDAVNLDGEALYGWDREINAADVETVVQGVVPTASSDEEMPRIIIYSGTHGNEAGHLVNDGTSRGFVAEDQATAAAAIAADSQVQADVIDVVTGYPTKGELTANYGRTNYIRILAWCFSQRSYNLGNNIKSNWWAAPDAL